MPKLNEILRVYEHLLINNRLIVGQATMFQIDSWILLLIATFIVLIQIKRVQTYPYFAHKHRLIAIYLAVSLPGFTYFFHYNWGLEHIIMSIAMAMGISFSFINPVNAISFFAANLLLRPWEQMEKNLVMSMIPKTLAFLSFFAFLTDVIRYNAFGMVWHRSWKILLLFTVWLFMSTFVRNDPDSAQYYFFETYFKYVIVFFLMLNQVRDKLGFQTIMFSSIIACLGIALKALYYTQDVADLSIGPVRLESLGQLGNSNDLGAVFIFIFPFVFIPLIQKKAGIFAQTLAMALAGLFFWVLWETQSRTALLAFTTIIGLYVLLQIKHLFLRGSVAAFGLAFFLLLQLNLKRTEDDMSESTKSRINYTIAGINMAVRNPIFGVGFNGYPSNFTRYAPELQSEWGHRTAHSSWILALAESGFIGFFLYVALYLVSLYQAWIVREHVPSLLYVTIGYGISMSFLSHTYMFFPFALFALTAVAERLYQPQINQLA